MFKTTIAVFKKIDSKKMEELHTYLDFLFYCPTQKKTKTSTVTITTHCQH